MPFPEEFFTSNMAKRRSFTSDLKTYRIQTAAWSMEPISWVLSTYEQNI